jgi:mannose-6-phosphate isomerase-like protein (cupin superfamily)
MALVIPIDEVRRSERAALFQGRDRAPVSIFILTFQRGEGPSLHMHPYPEVFVIQEGTGEFTAGDDQLTVTGGNILVVPAETPHGFKGAGDDTLRVVSVHPSPTVIQTNLVDPEYRVLFDFEVDFENGGGIQGQDFRLDIHGGDISDKELGEAIVNDMRLLMVSEVRILKKQIVEEPHKRTAG